MSGPEVGSARPQSRKLIPGKILGAAAEEFIEHGYGRASMDSIARRAGVSKATIYAHFASKQELFGAIIREACEEMRTSWVSAFGEEASVRGALRAVGQTFASFILQPRTLAVFRIVISEAKRFPELGQILYGSGPEVGLAQLAGFLESAARRGDLVVGDARRAADQFMGMIRGELYLRAVLGLETAATPAAVERLVADAVDTFMRAYGAPARESR